MRRTRTGVLFGVWNNVRPAGDVAEIDMIDTVTYLSWEFEKSRKTRILGLFVGNLEHTATACDDVETVFALLGFILHDACATLVVSSAKIYRKKLDGNRSCTISPWCSQGPLDSWAIVESDDQGRPRQA